MAGNARDAARLLAEAALAQSAADGIGAPVTPAPSVGRVPWDIPQRFGDSPSRPTTDMRRVGFAQQTTVAPSSIFNPGDYPNVTEGTIALVAGVSSKIIEAPSAQRTILGIANRSAAGIVAISFGTAATAYSWLQLDLGQHVMFDKAVPQNDVYALNLSGAGQVSFIYSDFLLHT